jgi:hypothetical protein
MENPKGPTPEEVIHLHSLANDESLSKFLTLMEWLIERLRKF